MFEVIPALFSLAVQSLSDALEPVQDCWVCSPLGADLHHCIPISQLEQIKQKRIKPGFLYNPGCLGSSQSRTSRAPHSQTQPAQSQIPEQCEGCQVGGKRQAVEVGEPQHCWVEPEQSQERNPAELRLLQDEAGTAWWAGRCTHTQTPRGSPPAQGTTRCS